MSLAIQKAAAFKADFENLFSWYVDHAGEEVAWRFQAALDRSLVKLLCCETLAVRHHRTPCGCSNRLDPLRPMKAYLVTTGLLAVLHVWRAAAEWPRPTVDPGFALLMAALVALPGVLSWWAWQLLRNLSDDRTRGGNEKMRTKDSDDSGRPRA
jgi:hypothetical protein